jgi:hypothetical protein
MYELYRSRCKQTDRLCLLLMSLEISSSKGLEGEGSVISGNRLGGYPESGLYDSPFQACRLLDTNMKVSNIINKINCKEDRYKQI